ncbi:MAG: MATE family efflux transporter [Lachnospiraceae bacterium]|nr:MATE family efflux transporter [Lachnospiraceae bacterium]
MNRFIGDRKFYRKVLTVTFPIMIQNGVTNFVGMLDNIMVGRIGTDQMSGVAIVNQLFFVFNICIFGALAGAGILGAQYYGKADYEGIRHVFRFKIICAAVMVALGLVILGGFGGQLISLYLHEGSAGNLEDTWIYGSQYLQIMLWGLLPFAVVQTYSSTLREAGETVMPMIASVCAVGVNLVLNYILIFGRFGAPVMGVRGAAVATVISRLVELSIIVIWTHTHSVRMPFAAGVYRSLYIPGAVIRQTVRVGLPLLVNEALWSCGMAVMTQFYSVRGLEVVAGLNISNTISNVFNVVYIAMGTGTGIILGQLLGAGKVDQAKDEDRKMIVFAVVLCAALGVGLFLLAPLFPRIYNTEEEVRQLATGLIRVTAVFMPVYGFYNCAYFTLRAGGKTGITFLFDSGILWAVSIPLLFCLIYFTSLSVLPVFILVQSVDIFRSILGIALLRKGIWARTIVVGTKQVA